MIKLAKTLKNYRFSETTLKQIEALQGASGKTATDIIEGIVNYVHEEYINALQGSNDEQFMLRQVLGKRIKKIS